MAELHVLVEAQGGVQSAHVFDTKREKTANRSPRFFIRRMPARDRFYGEVSRRRKGRHAVCVLIYKVPFDKCLM